MHISGAEGSELNAPFMEREGDVSKLAQLCDVDQKRWVETGWRGLLRLIRRSATACVEGGDRYRFGTFCGTEGPTFESTRLWVKGIFVGEKGAYLWFSVGKTRGRWSKVEACLRGKRVHSAQLTRNIDSKLVAGDDNGAILITVFELIIDILEFLENLLPQIQFSAQISVQSALVKGYLPFHQKTFPPRVVSPFR